MNKLHIFLIIVLFFLVCFLFKNRKIVEGVIPAPRQERRSGVEDGDDGVQHDENCNELNIHECISYDHCEILNNNCLFKSNEFDHSSILRDTVTATTTASLFVPEAVDTVGSTTIRRASSVSRSSRFRRARDHIVDFFVDYYLLYDWDEGSPPLIPPTIAGMGTTDFLNTIMDSTDLVISSYDLGSRLGGMLCNPDTQDTCRETIKGIIKEKIEPVVGEALEGVSEEELSTIDQQIESLTDSIIQNESTIGDIGNRSIGIVDAEIESIDRMMEEYIDEVINNDNIEDSVRERWRNSRNLPRSEAHRIYMQDSSYSDLDNRKSGLQGVKDNLENIRNRSREPLTRTRGPSPVSGDRTRSAQKARRATTAIDGIEESLNNIRDHLNLGGRPGAANDIVADLERLRGIRGEITAAADGAMSAWQTSAGEDVILDFLGVPTSPAAVIGGVTFLGILTIAAGITAAICSRHDMRNNSTCRTIRNSADELILTEIKGLIDGFNDSSVRVTYNQELSCLHVDTQYQRNTLNFKADLCKRAKVMIQDSEGGWRKKTTHELHDDFIPPIPVVDCSTGYVQGTAEEPSTTCAVGWGCTLKPAALVGANQEETCTPTIECDSDCISSRLELNHRDFDCEVNCCGDPVDSPTWEPNEEKRENILDYCSKAGWGVLEPSDGVYYFTGGARTDPYQAQNIAREACETRPGSNDGQLVCISANIGEGLYGAPAWLFTDESCDQFGCILPDRIPFDPTIWHYNNNGEILYCEDFGEGRRGHIRGASTPMQRQVNQTPTSITTGGMEQLHHEPEYEEAAVRDVCPEYGCSSERCAKEYINVGEDPYLLDYINRRAGQVDSQEAERSAYLRGVSFEETENEVRVMVEGEGTCDACFWDTNNLENNERSCRLNSQHPHGIHYSQCNYNRIQDYGRVFSWTDTGCNSPAYNSDHSDYIAGDGHNVSLRTKCPESPNMRWYKTVETRSRIPEGRDGQRVTGDPALELPATCNDYKEGNINHNFCDDTGTTIEFDVNEHGNLTNTIRAVHDKPAHEVCKYECNCRHFVGDRWIGRCGKDENYVETGCPLRVDDYYCPESDDNYLFWESNINQFSELNQSIADTTNDIEAVQTILSRYEGGDDYGGYDNGETVPENRRNHCPDTFTTTCVDHAWGLYQTCTYKCSGQTKSDIEGELRVLSERLRNYNERKTYIERFIRRNNLDLSNLMVKSLSEYCGAQYWDAHELFSEQLSGASRCGEVDGSIWGQEAKTTDTFNRSPQNPPNSLGKFSVSSRRVGERGGCPPNYSNRDGQCMDIICDLDSSGNCSDDNNVFIV